MSDSKYTDDEIRTHRLIWIQALESGQYQQTRQVLRDNEGFCCLGVACEVSQLGEWDYLCGCDYAVGGYEWKSESLPAAVMAWLGVDHPEVAVTEDEIGRRSYATTWNDRDMLSFSEIAANLRKLWGLENAALSANTAPATEWGR